MGLFPASFSRQSLILNFHHLYPEYRLLFQHLVPVNLVSRQESFSFSRIPLCISLKSRVPRIPFQTLYSLTLPRGMGQKLERNEKYCNFYCSSSITLVFPLFNPDLCGDPIFSIIIPKFTSYPGSSPKWSETRLARFLNATRM